MSTKSEPTPANPSDEQLLDRFVVDDDGDAFRTLVERHGPLVLNACRRALGSQADAEDAFQATFLVLAESAPKIRRRESLAAWLYGVATRVSARIRRQRVGKEPMEDPAIEADPLHDLLARHDARIADEELAALPTKLRTPLVLRYLAGKSNTEVANELGITVTALEGRLKRGKARLRVRLLKRGIMLTTLVASLKASETAAACVSPSLIERTTLICTGQPPTSPYPLSDLDAPPPAGGADPSLALQPAREELFAMKAALLIKPTAAIATLGSLAVLTVATQMAIAQGDAASSNTQDNAEGKAEVVLQAEAPAGTTSTAELPAAPIAVTPRNDQEEQKNMTVRLSEEEGQFFASFPVAQASVATTSEGAERERNQARTEAISPNQFLHVATKKNLPHVRFADAKQRSPSEQKIEAALVSEVASFDFMQTPLEEVCEFLKDEYEIQVVLDVIALDGLGFQPDVPVDIDVKGIPLESALRLMLNKIELTHIIKDDVLLITSQEDAEVMLENRIYPFTSESGFEYAVANAANAETMLTEVVAPESWAVNGGGEAVIANLGDRLVIRQTYAVHKEINKLLLQLKEGQKKAK